MDNLKIELASFDECTGCGVCQAVCAKDAIQMEFKEGFIYPQINHDLCVQCGRCMRTCPIIKAAPDYEISSERKTYCGYSTDKEHLKKSSSGSISYELNKYAFDKGYSVYGVAFNVEGVLVYMKATSESDLEKFIGSKYIQGRSENVYKQIKDDIREGRKVLFTGLPCVLSGVRNYLTSNELEHVIFIKIICHGISSPQIFNSIYKYIERQHNDKIVSYNFRSKAHGWQRQSVLIRFAGGKVINQLALDNLHHYWFAYHYNLRLSCFHCKHRTYDEADLILGDWWGFIDSKKQIKNKEGLSVIFANTSKGIDFLDKAKKHLYLENITIEEAVDRQPPLYQNPIIPEMRDRFIEDYQKMNFESFVIKYQRKPSTKERIKKFMFGMLFYLQNKWE